MSQYFEVHPDNPQPRLLKQAGQSAPKSTPILEVNPEHALVKRLEGVADPASRLSQLSSWQLAQPRLSWPCRCMKRSRPLAMNHSPDEPLRKASTSRASRVPLRVSRDNE